MKKYLCYWVNLGNRYQETLIEAESEVEAVKKFTGLPEAQKNYSNGYGQGWWTVGHYLGDQRFERVDVVETK